MRSFISEDDIEQAICNRLSQPEYGWERIECDPSVEKLKRLDAVVDRINKLNGSETIVIASQQYTKPGGKGRADVFSNAMKQDHKSKNPTTRWSDIIKLK